MSEFNDNYLKLLRKQVDDEIEFLIRNGHNSDQITLPCMFCVQHQHGYYYCRRLTDLRQFQSSIISHNQTVSRVPRVKPTQRRTIGIEPQEDSKICAPSSCVDIGLMPLLSIPL